MNKKIMEDLPKLHKFIISNKIDISVINYKEAKCCGTCDHFIEFDWSDGYWDEPYITYECDKYGDIENINPCMVCKSYKYCSE